MTATVIPLPVTPRLDDPASHAALAELVQIGLAVARTAGRLAAAEDAALDALAEAAATTARILATPPASLDHARRAGQDADTSEAARQAALARVAIITGCFEKAARAVRRTVALQARLATGRPFPDIARRDIAIPVATPPARPDRAGLQRDRQRDMDPAEQADRPETGDELGATTDEQAIRSIHRDLSAGASTITHLGEPSDSEGFCPPLPAPKPRPDPRDADAPNAYAPNAYAPGASAAPRIAFGPRPPDD